MTMHNIIILGHTGYIGSHLINSFKKKEISVLGIDQIDGLDVRDPISIRRVITSDLETVYCTFGMDHHITQKKNNIRDNLSDINQLSDYFNINVIGVANVAKALEDIEFKGRLVVLNSIYGKQIPPMELYTTPKNIAYSVSKYGLHSLLKQLAHRVSYGISNVILGPVSNPEMDNSFRQIISQRFPSKSLCDIEYVVETLVKESRNDSRYWSSTYREIDLSMGFI